MFEKESGLLQGTVELLILKTLSWGPMHGYGIASWIESATDDVLRVEEGDADGNVNHFQSEELYNFGRRLGKQVVYLVYEGENHNVARPESQMDYLRRQLEWFGHYLKGEPAAPWIADGEPYLVRQRILRDGAAAEPQPVQAGSPTRPTNRRP